MPHHPLPLNRLYLAHGLSECCLSDDGQSLFYVKIADGRRSIVRQSLATGLAQSVTAEPLPAGTVGYGGALYAVRGDVLIYAAKDKAAKGAKGGQLHGLNLTTGEQWPITPAYEGVAAPAISPCGQFVAFLCEQDKHCNVLLCDVRGKTLPIKLSEDPWYAFNPNFSPDGARLAWQEWNEHDMPWDEARLVIARLARPTREASHAAALLPPTTHTIAKARVSYAAPQFSPDGKYLAYISDESGWRSLWIGDPDGNEAVRVDSAQGEAQGEVGGPDWVPGLYPARWSDDGQALYAVRRHASRAALLRIAWPSAVVAEIPVEWTQIDYLNTRGSQLTFIGSTPTSPAVLVTLDTASGAAAVRAAAGIGLIDANTLSQPEVISWNTVGDTPAWGIFYPAVGPEADKGPRPLIVSVHGGPTSERDLGWDPAAQYFATRGWHVLLVNYRGGTGFGRAYQDLLNGQWGVVDVEDSRTGAEHLIESGLADPQRVVITGGSAGGYTTLMALTQDPDFWTAGVSLFGIGNHYDLIQGSHRFEVNYNDPMLGRLPDAGPLWKERSPLTHVKNVRAPVLLFHGKEDQAVPYQQSVEFAEAVRRNGGLAELVLYDDEGHGFLKEANRRDTMEKMEKFLMKYVVNLQK
jgi:acetyl esterase/lipase